MCLITRQKTPLIAEEDMKVFKVLTRENSSIFQTFTYELGMVYREKIHHSKDWTSLGVRDRDWLRENYPGGTWKKNEELICLGQGFHSINKLDLAKEVLLEGFFNYFKNTGIFECTGIMHSYIFNTETRETTYL